MEVFINGLTKSRQSGLKIPLFLACPELMQYLCLKT